VDAGSACGSGGGTGFPITLGATAIAASSTTTAVTGLSVNGVSLNAAGSSTLFLNQAGGYTAAGGSSPLTTKGDLFGHSTVDARIPVGTNGTVLTADSTAATGVSWQTGGSGTFQPSVLPNPPALSAFTWVNQGSDTTSNNGNSIMVSIPSVGSLSWGILKKTAPVAPWSVADYTKAAMVSSGNAQDVGLYLYDGTKLLGIEVLVQGRPILRIERINNVTTDNSTVFTQSFGATDFFQWPNPMTGGMFVRWRDDGTTLFADYSLDGSNWFNLYSEAVGAFITPTAYGFGGLNDLSAQPLKLSVQGWLETNSGIL
jgi:hypothetical protein